MNDPGIDYFDDWREEVPRFLREFREFMTAECPEADLDLSIDSLDHVESWLLGRYPSTTAFSSSDDSTYSNWAAVYVGEVLRKESGGEWDIVDHDKTNVYYGLPVVQLPDNGHTCPLVDVTTAIDRRTGNNLSTFVRKRVKPLPKLVHPSKRGKQK